MIRLFRKKTFLERVVEAVGRKRPRVSGTARRSGLIALGSAAGLTAASAAVSAIRDRRDQGGDDDRS